MNGNHPDLDRIKRYLHDLPAALEGPDAHRLDAILQQIRPHRPAKRSTGRSRHTFWWLALALATGMATAAIWHQARRLTEKPVEIVQPVPQNVPEQENGASAGPHQNRGSETPLTRPDTRFIPK